MAANERTYNYLVYASEFAIKLIYMLTDGSSMEHEFGLDVDIDTFNLEEPITFRIVNNHIEIISNINSGPLHRYYKTKFTEKQLLQFTEFSKKFNKYALEKYNQHYDNAVVEIWRDGTDECQPNAFLYGLVARLVNNLSSNQNK